MNNGAWVGYSSVYHVANEFLRPLVLFAKGGNRIGRRCLEDNDDKEIAYMRDREIQFRTCSLISLCDMYYAVTYLFTQACQVALANPGGRYTWPWPPFPPLLNKSLSSAITSRGIHAKRTCSLMMMMVYPGGLYLLLPEGGLIHFLLRSVSRGRAGRSGHQGNVTSPLKY